MTTFIDLAEQYGIQFVVTPRGLRCRCPLHREKTPSFYASDETGIFLCMGCRVVGNAEALAIILAERGAITYPDHLPANTDLIPAMRETIADVARRLGATP